MAKKKPEDKDTNEQAAQGAGAHKPAYHSGSVQLSPDVIDNISHLVKQYKYTIPAYMPPVSFITPVSGIGISDLYPTALHVEIPSTREQELEDEINRLRKEHWQLIKETAAKTRSAQRKAAKIEELQKNLEELSKKQRLQHLLYRVNEKARKKLLESEDFRRQFEKSGCCAAVVMSVDIRRSTELMLKAREPQLYADFITSLCNDLIKIILDNFGVFDKFTGDGILAFFPNFYSGQDSPYLAIKAAQECHKCFSMHYQAKRSCFNSVLLDVGLGIGIDYGESHLVNMQDGLTVIGTPVVYACRLSGARAGQTLLNQPAYEVTSQKFGEFVNFQESEIDIKHEGRTLAYVATLSNDTYEPKLPDWL